MHPLRYMPALLPGFFIREPKVNAFVNSRDDDIVSCI